VKVMIAVVTSLSLVAAVPVGAESSFGTRNAWSSLTKARLHQMPPELQSAIRSAQAACGNDEPVYRTGFLRYFKSVNGREFVSLHFDEFQCRHSSQLCGNSGCLHRIFESKGSLHAREVWRGHVRDIDMENHGGQPVVNVSCVASCNQQRLLWNGSSFR
jgi:hypothetical protein